MNRSVSIFRTIVHWDERLVWTLRPEPRQRSRAGARRYILISNPVHQRAVQCQTVRRWSGYIAMIEKPRALACLREGALQAEPRWQDALVEEAGAEYM